MPVLFGPYRPDVNDLNQSWTQSIKNVLPQTDGYGPFPSLSSLTSTLPAPARGAFIARVGDGTIAIFAGTATDLYLLNNTSLAWTLVSKGGTSYTGLNINAMWRFAQFNSRIVAVQANTVPQFYDLNVSTAFADLAGSPPNAAYIAVVNRFVVLTGLLSNPNRIIWSGLNNTTQWTSGVNFSDFQDLPDGGICQGAIGGNYGLVFQETAIRKMTFSPGADTIFQIDKLGFEIGLLAPNSLCGTGDMVFFLSNQGFIQTDFSGNMTRIGQQYIDKTFFNTYDTTTPGLLLGAVDPMRTVVYFTWRKASDPSGVFSRVFAFNWLLQRWGYLEFQGEYLLTAGTPGLTLEGLDAVVPGNQAITGVANNGSGLMRVTVGSTTGWNTGDTKTISGVTGTGGLPAAINNEPRPATPPNFWIITVVDATHIDLQGSAFTGAYTSGGVVGGSEELATISFDAISNLVISQLAAFGTNNTLGFFSGPNLEATVETAEQGDPKERAFIGRVHPLTDAPSVFLSVARRENRNATPVYSAEVGVNSLGICGARVSAKFSRLKLRIPSGTSWSYVNGLEPQGTGAGRR